MKTITNIYFEKLHRFVYDYYYIHNTVYVKANRNNKLERYNKNITDIYNFLCPYFDGWRENLVKKYPENVIYQRYK